MAYLLERSSWEPLHFQISERLRERITGELAPGARIPSENELIAEYQVSRNTVREAIDTLIKQGLVQRVKGKGTFVTSGRLQFGLHHLASFTEEIQRLGMRPSSRLVHLQRLLPPQNIRGKLQLSQTDEVFFIERLRMANGKPMALNASYIPCKLFPVLDQEDILNGSIYQIIENKYHRPIGYAQQFLKPTIANESEADLLQVKAGSALLQVEGTAFLVDDTPFEFATLTYRGDLYEFPIQAVRRPREAGEPPQTNQP